MKLQGVQGHTIDPSLDEVKIMKDDLKALYDAKLKKRSIQVNVTGYQR